jgi:hypothetical protein
MFTWWKIAIVTLLVLCAGVTAQAAGAQSEPKQKGAEKGEPASSETNGERRQPSRPNEPPGDSKTHSSAPPSVPEFGNSVRDVVIRDAGSKSGRNESATGGGAAQNSWSGAAREQHIRSRGDLVHLAPGRLSVNRDQWLSRRHRP